MARVLGVFERNQLDGVGLLLGQEDLEILVQGVGEREEGGALALADESVPSALDVDAKAPWDVAVPHVQHGGGLGVVLRHAQVAVEVLQLKGEIRVRGLQLEDQGGGGAAVDGGLAGREALAQLAKLVAAGVLGLGGRDGFRDDPVVAGPGDGLLVGGAALLVD